jgi:hypothetical protein
MEYTLTFSADQLDDLVGTANLLLRHGKLYNLADNARIGQMILAKIKALDGPGHERIRAIEAEYGEVDA